MKTQLAIACAALLLATGAQAKPVKKSILPPAEFDHPFVGTIYVTRLSETALECRPRSLSTRLACTYPPGKDGPECEIHLALLEEIKDAGYRENDLWRREIAYCNGWKGYQPLGTDPSDKGGVTIKTKGKDRGNSGST
jgi:hypothetical protein